MSHNAKQKKIHYNFRYSCFDRLNCWKKMQMVFALSVLLHILTHNFFCHVHDVIFSPNIIKIRKKYDLLSCHVLLHYQVSFQLHSNWRSLRSFLCPTCNDKSVRKLLPVFNKPIVLSILITKPNNQHSMIQLNTTATRITVHSLAVEMEGTSTCINSNRYRTN